MEYLSVLPTAVEIVSENVEIVSGFVPKNLGKTRKNDFPYILQSFLESLAEGGPPLSVPPIGAPVVPCPAFENVGRLFSTGGRTTTSPPGAWTRRPWKPSRALPGVLG